MGQRGEHLSGDWQAPHKRTPPSARMRTLGGPTDRCSGSAGLLVVRLLIVRLLFVELFLDLRVAQQLVRVGLHLLGLHNLLEALTDIVIWRRLQITRLDQLDNM